jgi:hypothetical protein
MLPPRRCKRRDASGLAPWGTLALPAPALAGDSRPPARWTCQGGSLRRFLSQGSSLRIQFDPSRVITDFIPNAAELRVKLHGLSQHPQAC